MIRLLVVLKEHRLFFVVLTLGIALRVLAQITYRPGLLFFGDSFSYLESAEHLRPETHPIGYPLFLRLLRPAGDLSLVTLSQHALGVAAGVAVYLGLRRLSVGRGFSSGAAGLILLDGHQVNLESYVMAETLMLFLVVTSIVCVVWSRLPSIGTTAVAGACLGFASITRTAAIGVVVPVVGFALLRRFGVVRVTLLIGAFLAPLAWQTILFENAHGRYALSTKTGSFLYGRVAPFADCTTLPGHLDDLCDPRPARARPEPAWFVWSAESPLNTARLTSDRDATAGAFASFVLGHQPMSYVRTVATDVLRYGVRSRYSGYWSFPDALSRPDEVAQAIGRFERRPARPPELRPGTAAILRRYQSIVSIPPLALVALAFAPGVLGGRAFRRAEPSASWPRGECLLFGAAGLVLLLIPTMTVEYSVRFLNAALPLLVCSAAIAGHGLMARREASGPRDD